MEDITFWESLTTDIRTQLSVAALIISLYVAFRNSHKDNDHVEVILENPIYTSNHIYLETKSGKEKKDNIKKVLHGRILINNASRHNIGYYGFNITLDEQQLFILHGNSFDKGLKLLSKTLGPHYHIIATGEEYLNGNIKERSQHQILFVACDLETLDIPVGKNIKIHINFLKPNFASSIPVIRRWIPKTKKVTFKYKLENVQELSDIEISKKPKIIRI